MNGFYFRNFTGCALATLIFSAPALAHAPRPAAKPALPALEVFMPGDDLLDCRGLNTQITSMEELIYNSDDAQRKAESTGTGISIAKAVGGFLIGSIPGAIGVMAVGHVAGEAAEGEAASAEEQENIAAQRRSMLIGMYNAKGCKGPLHNIRALRNATIDETARHPAHIEPAAGPTGRRQRGTQPAHKVTYNE